MKRFPLVIVSCLLMATAIWVGHNRTMAAGGGCKCEVKGQGWTASGTCVQHGGGEMGPCYPQEPCVATYNEGECKITGDEPENCECTTITVTVHENTASCGSLQQCECKPYQLVGGWSEDMEVPACG